MASVCSGLLPGTYSVCATDVSGCSICSAVTVINSTGTNELSLENNISIYPNPAREYITIEMNFESYTKMEISVFNDLGEKVYFEETSVQQGKKKISLAQLPVGLYFLRARTDSGIYTKRVIRQ